MIFCPSREECPSINKPEFSLPFIKTCVMSSLIKIGPVVWRWRWKRGPWARLLAWKTFLSYDGIKLSKTMNINAGWLKVIYISPWKKAWPFTCKKKLISFHQRMLWGKFGWYWPSGSGEAFEISSMYFGYWVPFEKSACLHLYVSLKLDRPTYKQAIRKAHLSLKLSWATKIESVLRRHRR